MSTTFNSNFVFRPLIFRDPTKKFTVNNVNYKLYHHGLENQKAYYTLCDKNGKSLYIEIVNHPGKGWSYFAETKRNPLVCSLVGRNKYYDSAEEAHKTVLRRLNNLIK
jgi:hypothetical protein